MYFILKISEMKVTFIFKIKHKDISIWFYKDLIYKDKDQIVLKSFFYMWLITNIFIFYF
jgi:hypothetical protein